MTNRPCRALPLLLTSLLLSPGLAWAAEPGAERAPLGGALRQAGDRTGEPEAILEKGLAGEAVAGSVEEAARASAAREVALGDLPGPEEMNELRQSVALLAGGGYAAVWVEGSPADSRIRVQYVRTDGTAVFAGGGLTVSPADRSYAPVLVANPRGGVFVAYRYWPEPGEAGNRLLVQWLDGAGRPRWPGEGVPAVEAFDLHRNYTEAHLVAAPDGGVFACFMADPLNSNVEIRCQRFGADGTRLWGASGVTAGERPGWRVLPKAVADGSGGLLVFWRNQRVIFDDQRVDPMLIEGQHLAADGARLWGRLGRIVRTTNLAESNSYVYGILDAVADGAGGAVVSFHDWSGQGSPSFDVLAQRVTGDGRLLWGAGAVVAGGSAQQQHDALIAAPDGGAFVTVWEVIDEAHSRLWLHRLGPDGRRRWPAKGIALASGGAVTQDYGAYGQADGDRVRVAWIHQAQIGTFSFDVRLATFDLAGRRLDGPNGTAITAAEDAQFLRGFVFDPRRGQGLAVWNDRRRGSWEEMDVFGGLFSATR